MTIITNKTVLLTGASRGLGVHIAHALAKEQATIIGISRSKPGLNKTRDEVKALGGQFIGFTFDITNVEHLSGLVQHINNTVSPVDILINNTGVEIYQSFANYSLKDLQSVLTTNLLAAMELTRLLLPSMLERGSGHIVNISSLAGKKGVPYNSIYSASKAGLIMWTDSLRQELVRTGINFSAICPGYISETGMTVDSGLPAPTLAGISTPQDVANSVIRAIKKNKAEVIINESAIAEFLTKVMFAIGQITPQFVDAVYRWIAVAKLNQMRAENFANNQYKRA
ncbi:SDR family NAD(P)-dependent oxidoreductase [Chlorogloeopsis fritschii PCC 9212]|uniref:3-ketoacyl-ACP reductase n=1 Tax=Chlorogloeopsis fritschii PCC 6912 TaxID=211165 RepID=A0A3S1AND9_CHLFR|nr:SDR family NAD(P)-dependent oxidoreductase [Chlorogloeopsis fritschii]MBF2005751.1 SDR family NAD(P)-dependent oxidoreductase [Chlorogloeopsis fritschii C42_A2020_084]RUR85867.1 3-ketoacyl-ACP reductase [Chlorogloeopsis fritschii PCC 6912]